MSSKVEKILIEVLFISGIILFLFSFTMLIYQIIHTTQIDFNQYIGADRNEAITYVVIEFINIIFRLVIASYAIYTKKNLDDALNPLFTFTILYVIFVILELAKFILTGGVSLGVLVTINVIVDICVATFFLINTLVFKIDDWRPYKSISK